MEIKKADEDGSSNSKIGCMHALTYRQAPVMEHELHTTQ